MTFNASEKQKKRKKKHPNLMDTTFNDKNSSLSTNSNSSAFWDYKKYKAFEHKKFRKYEKTNPTFSLLDQ